MYSINLRRPTFLFVVSTHSSFNVADTLGSALSAYTGVVVPGNVMTTREGAPVPATVLRFERVNWTVANCTSKYADYFQVLRFDGMFSDGDNAIVYV